MPELERRALNLERLGLYAYAEHALEAWRQSAEAVGAWAAAAEAATRAVRFALDRDELNLALTHGARALPYVLGRSRIDPNIRARLYINLTKAAWGLGRDRETRAYLDAASCIVEHERVDPLIGVHLAIAAAIVAMEDDDLRRAAAWGLQALEIADAIADEATVLLCRYNLSHIWMELGEFDRADELVANHLAAAGGDLELVDLLVNGIGIAIGQGDLVRAGGYARRAVSAYCASPSHLSPRSVAYLFEVLAWYHGALGANASAAMLADTAKAWFAQRQRDRDVTRVQAWLANQQCAMQRAVPDEGGVDPDLLYLGDLCGAAWGTRIGAHARKLALSVNHLLPEVAPQAPLTPCENAALLWPLPVNERWFTGRSAVGQAAERVLSGVDTAGHSGLKLLAGYEHLAAGGASWAQNLRVLRRQGVDSAGLQALDELYRTATA